MILLAVNKPEQVPQNLSCKPNDPKKPLLEKIRKLEQEIREQCLKAEKFCLSTTYDEGRRTYKHLKKQEKLLKELIEHYYQPTSGDIDLPKNEIEIAHIPSLILQVSSIIKFVGQDLRRQKVIKNSLLAITKNKRLPDCAFITVRKNNHLYRYYVIAADHAKVDVEQLIKQFLQKSGEPLPIPFQNLSIKNGWHKLILPGESQEFLYHITLSPTEMRTLIEQEQFAELEEYIMEEGESFRILKLQYIFNKLTSKERTAIFEKAKQFRTIGNSLVVNLDFSSPATLQSALRFALDGVKCAELYTLIKRFPQCTIENPLPADILWLVRMGAIYPLQDMLKKGFKLDVKKTVYDPSFGTQRRCANSGLLLYIRTVGASSCNPFEFIKLVTDHGLDLNKPAEILGELRVPLEVVVFDFEDEKEYHRLVQTYLDCGAKPTPEIQRFWMARAHLPQFRFYLEYMKRNRLISDEEHQILTQPPKNNPRGIDLNKAIHYRLYLEKMVKAAHLNRSALNLHTIREIHAYKKEFKKNYLKNPTRNADIYRFFCTAYDKVVSNHVLLNELREISRDFRKHIRLEMKSREFALRTISFVAAWHFTADKESVTVRLNALLPTERPDIWNNCYNRVLDAAERLKKDKYLSRHNITWLHGTKSSSLPCFLKLKKILCMGDLLAQDIVTFSGEHCGSDRDNDHKINKDHVSGEKPSRTWDDGRDSIWYNAPTRTMLARYYAENVHNSTNTLNFDQQDAMERISLPHMTQLLGVKDFYRRHGVFVRTRFDVLRLRCIGAKVDEHLAALKVFLEEKLKGILTADDASDIQMILDAISKPLVMNFDNDDLKYMMDPRPYGIVFGSTKINSTPYQTEQCTTPHEYLVKSPIHFKKDIQVAFTRKEKVEELKQKLKPSGIRVYDFEMAMVQELINMAINTRCEKYSDSLGHYDDITKGQLELAHELQLRILPEYAMPYPPNPSYKDEAGTKILLDEPFYEEHLKKVEEGQTIARLIHGPMHSARGAIWTLVIHRLREIHDKTPRCNTNIFQKAFSFHDIMRQNEGKDYWDRSSARYYYTHRIVSDTRNVNLKAFTHALEFKDPKNRQFANGLHEDIHDADVVEIFPRALADIKDFRREELCFFTNHPEIPEESKEALLREMFAFNQYTNNPKLHLYMETSVENYYAELMRLMKYVFVNLGELSMLNHLLEPEIAAFAGKELDGKIVELISEQD